MHRTGKIIKNSVLTIIFIFSVLVIASSIGLFGYKAYVVRSGSMEPKIKVGGVVVDTRNTNYRIGDVITFRRAGYQDPISHRIVKINRSVNGSQSFVVKGDANPVADPSVVNKSNIIGKMSFTVPYIGYAVLFIKTLPGLILCIIVPAAIIIYNELASLGRQLFSGKTTKYKLKRSSAI